MLIDPRRIKELTTEFNIIFLLRNIVKQALIFALLELNEAILLNPEACCEPQGHKITELHIHFSFFAYFDLVKIQNTERQGKLIA